MWIICGNLCKQQVKKVYYFNPQNDLALATGGINYVAPPFAMRMASDLAVLPAFIAPHGSLLITDSDLDAEWLDHLRALLGIDVKAVKRHELRHLSNCRIMPWGWCLDMRRRLLKWGASRDSVPSKEEIYHLRGLSHRRISVLMHLRLQELLNRQLCPTPVEIATTPEVMDFVARYRQCFIKTPWSSSGRGIYHTTAGTTPELEQWCNGALKRQGSVLCEVALDKVMDLAVEFYCENGKAATRGYSVFETDSHSQYHHSLVASSKVLKNKIEELYPEFDTVVNAVRQVLDELVAPHYTGWLGVDMLLFNNAQFTMHNAQSATNNAQSATNNAQSATNNAQCTIHNAQCTIHNAQSATHNAQFTMHNAQCTMSDLQAGEASPHSPHGPHHNIVGINPCVELNLRPTMGAITSCLGDTILPHGTTATFTIEQRGSTSQPWQELPEPVLENKKLVAGALCLTTPSPTALYRAIVVVGSERN